jgi:glucosamine-phosphate N-acetyltransferase
MCSKEIEIREITKSDMPQVISLLQLISPFKPSEIDYSNIWDKFNNQSNVLSVVVVDASGIIGYGSIMIEIKIRGGKIGHIEDIVSGEASQRKGVGKAIVEWLTNFALAEGCYKVTLSCKQKNVGFYQKCNYQKDGFTMQRFLS